MKNIPLLLRADCPYRGSFRALLASGVLIWTLATGCHSPSFAPLSRVGVSTLPEPAGPRGGSVQMSYGYSYSHVVEPRGTMGLTDWLDLDLNGMAIFGGMMEDKLKGSGMYMGSLGLRAYYVPTKWFRVGFAGGLSLGWGGLIGLSSTPGEEPDYNEHGGVAGGGYVGVDVGFRIVKYFGIYLGNRISMTRSERISFTTWGYHVLGLQVDFSPRVFATVESGIAWYKTLNPKDSAAGSTIIYGSLGYRFSSAWHWQGR